MYFELKLKTRNLLSCGIIGTWLLVQTISPVLLPSLDLFTFLIKIDRTCVHNPNGFLDPRMEY